MNYNALHPYPRYGAAVALAEAGLFPTDVVEPAHLARLTADAIEKALVYFFVYTEDDPDIEGVTLSFDWVRDPDPGSKSGQTAKNGYYLSPHVVTSDGSAAGLLKQAKAYAVLLRDEAQIGKSASLQRSFAPLVAKVNAGTASLSDPKTSALNAGLTLLATITPDKAAAWSGGTAGLIPDLPLVDERPGQFPLLDFVRLFRRMRTQQYDSAKAMTTPPKKGGGYKRPFLHNGNFPGAPSSDALSSLGLVAGVGWWAKNGQLYGDDEADEWARVALERLAERPLLIVSYDGSRQEHFGHHLVGLAMRTDMSGVLSALRRIMPTAADGWKDPKVGLFRMMADRFLRLFSRPALRDFLAIRAAYPPELAPIFDAYFSTRMSTLDPQIVASARSYGAALNYAAYRAAKASTTDDERRRGASSRSVEEYKQRALVEMESAIQSAKSGPEMLAKAGSRAGRLGGFEIPSGAGVFMEAVASGTVELGDARDLVTAFMRLSTWKPKESGDGGSDEQTTIEDAPGPEAPSDLPPDFQAEAKSLFD